jgi:hypothetical protein
MTRRLAHIKTAIIRVKAPRRMFRLALQLSARLFSSFWIAKTPTVSSPLIKIYNTYAVEESENIVSPI